MVWKVGIAGSSCTGRFPEFLCMGSSNFEETIHFYFRNTPDAEDDAMTGGPSVRKARPVTGPQSWENSITVSSNLKHERKFRFIHSDENCSAI